MNHAPFLALAASFVVASSAISDEPHKKWMDYFQGGWESESSNGEKGGTEFKYVPGHYATIGTRSTKPGGVQLVGWQMNRNVLVDTEYGADGAYSVIEYDKFGDKEMHGKFVHYWDPEKGDRSGATIVVKIESLDVASAVISGRTKDGEPFELRLTFKRKK